MPILDPSLQSTLFKLHNRNYCYYRKYFFLKYLRIASNNLYRNLDSIESSIQFKKDMKSSIDFLNRYFGCHFKEDTLFNHTVKDCYKYLYDHINAKFKRKKPDDYGSYIELTRDDIKINLFEVEGDYSEYHYWFFSDVPIAILTIRTNEKKVTDKFTDLIQLINLETDLMIASGYTLVLCVLWDIEKKYDVNLLLNTICTHKFSEIHFNIIFNSKSCKAKQYESLLSNILNCYDQFDCYFYMYSPISKEISEKSAKILSNLNHKPRFSNFSLSKKINKSFERFYIDESSSFSYCENGFDYEKIRILLSNVPLYDNKSEERNFTPSQITEISMGYIKKDDFLNWKNQRVKILFDDQKNAHHHVYKYINFDDIHLIRLDMYLENIIYTANTDLNTIELIESISQKCDYKCDKNEKFKKEKILALFKDKKIRKALTYVLYAYQFNFRKLVNEKFHLHNNQILTVLKACDQCLTDTKSVKNDSGVIFQIETGEGKSCIINLIAALLALMGKKVHIASSNINLSNRDYYESYHFFKSLGFTSAVLLHYNELPFITFNNEQNDDTLYDIKFYPDIFFDKSLFNNPSNMNFSVCGIDNNNKITKNNANIVFSTFVNFECLYLKMMEMCPGYINKYFGKRSLLIDEADSILIDELTNGTILSRTIKTNGEEVLKYVYNSKMKKKKSAKKVHKEIIQKWPKCKSMTLDDVIGMFEDIDLINNEEFENGKKYSIETIEVNDKDDDSDDDLFDKIEKFKEKSIKKMKNIIQGKKVKKTKKKVKQIVPFDYENKGILEPNKEFSGFVQQFIAIKEMMNNEENKNMIIKDVSLNYLYVSHPIFIKLYSGVCGVTGTVGNKYDKKILKEQYNLTTMKIPRENPNFRVEFPVILCSTIKERNLKIVSEIIDFRNKEFPVLVIFQNLNEITDVFHMLISRGIKNINIFDGKDEKIKPDRISGIKGAVSLGTNFCGRGTDIKNPRNPLHIIVSYYTSNSRIMYQAYGRTARQGQKGSVHVICLKNEYLEPIRIFNENDMKNTLTEYQFKNQLQIEFIEKFKKTRDWIFAVDIQSQILSREDIEKLRSAKINVNRINAFNFEYPICMSIQIFLDIQAQKIFSLYNCPNCKYTWMLFQKYIREMILESWSIFIDQTQRKYFRMKSKLSFDEFLKDESKTLFDLLQFYLPESANPNDKIYGIVPTFMNIFDIVLKKYENKVMKAFPEKVRNFYNEYGKRQFCTFAFGFKPFSLLDKSGSKIDTLNGEDQKMCFIKDPELKYMQKQPDNSFSILSITEKIDGIFNLICQKINEVIGSYIGLKFFLRRTLGGCEFGVCYDFDLENCDEKLKEDQNCLFDKDPLLLFTISVKSFAPVLAGILIIGLVFIASFAKSISEWIMAFPEKITKEVIKVTVKEIASVILKSQIEKLCEHICDFLIDKLNDEIKKMGKFDQERACIFNLLMKLVVVKDFEKSGDKINELFNDGTLFKMKSDFGQSLLCDSIPSSSLLKIGFLILLTFACFMLNFHYNKSVKYNSEKVSADYDKNQDTQKALNTNKKLVKFDKMDESVSEFELNIEE